MNRAYASQRVISEFTDADKEAHADSPEKKKSAGTEESVESACQIYDLPFQSNDGFPAGDENKTIEIHIPSDPLDTDDSTVCLEKIAGKGSMGGNPSIDNVNDVYTALAEYTGPVFITGGGMNTPMGSRYAIGTLEDVSLSNGSVQVDIRKLYTWKRTKITKKKVQTYTLGSYSIYLPKTEQHRTILAKSINGIFNDKIRYIESSRERELRSQQEFITNFKNIEVGNTIEIPQRETKLKVISEPTQCYKKTRNNSVGTSRSSVSITVNHQKIPKIVVDNPRGGYHSIGLKLGSESTVKNPPKCIISPPQTRTIPSANGPICENDGHLCPYNDFLIHNENVSIEQKAPIDEKIKESPMVPESLRQPITKFDGIGNDRWSEIFQMTDKSVSIESLAYTIYHDPTYHKNIDQIENIIRQTGNEEKIYDTLKDISEHQ